MTTTAQVGRIAAALNKTGWAFSTNGDFLPVEEDGWWLEDWLSLPDRFDIPTERRLALVARYIDGDIQVYFSKETRSKSEQRKPPKPLSVPIPVGTKSRGSKGYANAILRHLDWLQGVHAITGIESVLKK